MKYTVKHLNLTVPDSNLGRSTLFRNISLEIGENESIGVLGPSGTGKTQLSFSLGKLNTYYGGILISEEQKYVSEKATYDLKESKSLEIFRREEIAFIFQEAFSYFNPVKKIKSQLESLDKINSDELRNLFELTGLIDQDKILNSYPHQLSGGQLQRLAILHCLIRKPALIVADEIDSALDETNANAVIDLIFKLKKEQKFTLIWISHDQIKAKNLCDRIWYLDQGKMLYDGPAFGFEPVRFQYPQISTGHSTEPYLELEQIQKSYTHSGIKHTVLNQVSMKISQGEIVGLIGPSGSGKSTLAKIIAGLILPDSGNIIVEGKVTGPGRIPDKNIVYLFQDVFSMLNPSLNIGDILNEAIEGGRNNLKLEDLLSIGDFKEEIIHQKPSELSGGMRQRVAILRAIAIAPKLLVLDESLNALDHELRVKILNMLLTQVNQFRMSILIISHQVDLVKAVAHKTFVISGGEIILQ